MAKNVGRLDQILRAGIAIGLIYIGFIDNDIIKDSFSANIIGTIGLINLFVALSRRCPLYALADINTCPQKKK